MRFSKDGEGSGDCKKTYAAWIFSNVVGEQRYMVYYFTEKNSLNITYIFIVIQPIFVLGLQCQKQGKCHFCDHFSAKLLKNIHKYQIVLVQYGILPSLSNQEGGDHFLRLFLDVSKYLEPGFCPGAVWCSLIREAYPSIIIFRPAISIISQILLGYTFKRLEKKYICTKFDM